MKGGREKKGRSWAFLIGVTDSTFDSTFGEVRERRREVGREKREMGEERK